MNTRTDIATLTQEQVEQISQADVQQTEAVAQLERLIGTFESYGAFPTVRPNYSDKADLTRLDVKKVA